MKTYLCVYLGSALLALLITPALIWLGRRLKAIDRPGVRTIHSKPVPRIGGVAIFASTVCLVIPVLFLSNIIGDRFRGILPSVIVLLSTAGFIFMVGLVDDLKGLRARVKFLTELICALAVCAVGVRITSIAFVDWFIIDFGWLSWPFTVLWIVGITNAINLSDGLDGLAAGISAVACGVIAIFAISSGQVVMAVLMLAMLGSLTGFLFFNFNPAKIFMGDCGSMFLGFTIATSSVMCSTKSHALVGLALPVLVLGVPIFDTLFSMLRRFLERRSMFASDRSHFHHKLLDLGLKQRHVVVVIYAITLLAAGLGMFMMISHDHDSLIIFICVLLLILLVFRVVGSVRLRETISGLKQKYAVKSQMKEEVRTFERMQLLFRRVETFDDWWSSLCEAAEGMDFAWLSFKSIAADGTEYTEVWRAPNIQPKAADVMTMTIPVNGHSSGSATELEIAVLLNGSLESVGRRTSLFSRLLDEHDIADLPRNSITSSSVKKKH
ncbi:MAG: glycosyltransferase family 4 protein [Planctomycetota bacterium]|jgi:UDP-GlcNAc:undecaprenyl-phosphate GlcNAc-1-phosphate transferase